MNAPSMVDRVAEAVLYEGYLLYPYRPSTKNRQRWTFGGVLPEPWQATHDTGDSSFLRTECLARASGTAKLSLRLRALHIITRQIYRAGSPPVPVDQLESDGTRWQSWQEAAEREYAIPATTLDALVNESLRVPFRFEAQHAVEPLVASAGSTAGTIERSQQAIEGKLQIAATRLADDLCRLSAQVTNRTPCGDVPRETALLSALVSAHMILNLDDGEFLSLLEPPAEFAVAAAACSQQGLWPVLVGEPGQRDTMLASPIILYDYPQIAAESPGNLFDGAEIDEILSLRIMTLADDEKAAMRALDPRARALLDRTESLTSDQLAALHGAVRSLRPNNQDDRHATVR
ncbi:MAG TPA: hypothetical protein VHZ24_04155 [Pirellulales bacterium]|jgi:hypothetical protein|nr:hypothetical protein [Pirellulales bacterium]